MRRIAVAAVAVAAIAAAAVWAWRHTWRPGGAGGPIVLISIDTLRADHLPVYGYTGVRTPAIDALAADGVLFERAYSHSPQTLPAHTAILSGELPFETGVRDNIGFELRKGQWLLQRALHDQGWRTGGFVSAFVLRAATGIGQGFDVFDSDLPAAGADASVAQIQRDGAATLAAATRWLDGQADSRFFLFLHLYEPHKPYAPPARFAQYAPYDGEIAYSDELVGQLVDRLKARGVYDTATIVLLADHGEGLGDHGEYEHGVFLYDETIRVPLIVKLPGGLKGVRVPAPVQHIDVAPTILGVAGVPVPADLHGRSLRPLLDGTGAVPPGTLYAEALYSRYHFGWSELYALTDERYRFIRAPQDELYDLQRDPGEAHSLATERSSVRMAMRAALDRVLAGTAVHAPSAVSAADREKLAALGYVGSAGAGGLAASADTLPNPRDKIPLLETYRSASEAAGQGRFDQAVALYRKVVAQDPGMVDVWSQLGAMLLRLGRTREAVDAYKRFAALRPEEPAALLGVASALLRAGETNGAREHAAMAARLAHDVRGRADAHEMLARIGLTDAKWDEARAEARAAQQADPGLPLPAFVEGAIQYKQGAYAAAMTQFEQAIAASRDRTLQIRDLHYYAADTLARLQRYPEAEREFRIELGLFPANQQARAGLAMLYRATGRDADVARTIDDIVRVSPTPEGYALAARLWSIFGEPQRAEAVRRAAAAR